MDGLGNGPDAGRLKVPPEALAEIRTTRPYIQHTFDQGVNGTAMPRFTYYDAHQRGLVIDYLNSRWQVLESAPAVTYSVSAAAMDSARKTWNTTCSGCHGSDGRGTPQSAGFKPPPPDFTQYAPTPPRAFDIVTNGYPGTFMTSHSYLPVDVRWGLVKTVEDLRAKAGTARR
jgi:mono/diheme cytochrome c family protein